jgi:hypothetical protein
MEYLCPALGEPAPYITVTVYIMRGQISVGETDVHSFCPVDLSRFSGKDLGPFPGVRIEKSSFRYSSVKAS